MKDSCYVRGMSNAVGYGDPTAPGARLHKYGVAVGWAQPTIGTERGKQRPYVWRADSTINLILPVDGEDKVGSAEMRKWVRVLRPRPCPGSRG